MHVAALWRYPVKSLQGEALEVLELEQDGVVGDRAFGILERSSETVLSAKRERRLLEGRGRLAGGRLVVEIPGEGPLGPGPALDATLSRWLERPVRLVAAEGQGPATYLRSIDFEDEDGGGIRSWEGVPGRFVDACPLHLLTTASLRALAGERPDLDWAPLRFRPNVLIEAEGQEMLEEGFLGRRFSLGRAELEVHKVCSRCVVTTRAQPGIERQLDVLRHVNAAHATNLGAYARIVTPGAVKVGDRLDLSEVSV